MTEINIKEEQAKQEYMKNMLVSSISNDISQDCIYAQIFSLVCACALTETGKQFLENYKGFLGGVFNENTTMQSLEKKYPKETLKLINVKEIIASYKNVIDAPLKAVDDVLKNIQKENTKQ